MTRDGAVLWVQEPYGPGKDVNLIVTDKQRAYVGLNRASNPLQAYDLKSGKPIWVTEPLVPLSDSAQALEVNGDELYAVVDSNLFVLDSRTAAVKRTIPHFDQGNDIQLVNKVALTGSVGGVLAKGAKTGDTLWQFHKRPEFWNVIGDRAYVSTDCCALNALEFSTGQ